MLSQSEAAVRLSTRPSVIQRLIKEKLLRADHAGNIHAQDLESLRKNNALLARVSGIRKQVAIEEAAAQVAAEEQQQRRDSVCEALALELEQAKQSAEWELVCTLQNQIHELQLQGAN